MKKALTLFAFGLVTLACLGLATTAGAQTDLLGGACKDAAGNPVPAAAGAPGCESTGDRFTGPDGVIHNVTVIASIVGGIAAVIMLIVGGFLYVTSAGDSAKLTTAKNTIIYALVGLVVIALARTIILFVLSRV